MTFPSPGSCLRPDFLKKFDDWAAVGEWGSRSMKRDIEESILKPLEEKIRKDIPLQEEHKGYIAVLKFLASNPLSLREFVEWVIAGTYRGTTFTVCSLSKVRMAGTFRRLGINITDGYSIDAILEKAKSKAFKSLHACRQVDRKTIRELKGVLEDRRLLYPGDSEHVARAMINAHLEFLFDHEHFIASILELWLARSTSEYQPAMVEHTDANRPYLTYLTGRTDYMVLTITNGTRDRPYTHITAKNRKTAIEELELESLKGPMYSELNDHLSARLDADQGWESLFIEAKSTSLFSGGKLNASNLYQVIATCCIARKSGRKASQVLKFTLSSGRHWIFGVVDNTTATAYVTAVLDNSELERTHDVIYLLVLWMVLPGPLLKDHLFERLTPQPLPLNIEAEFQSQTGSGANEDTIPKAEGEEGDPRMDEGNLAKEEEGGKGDVDDERESSGAEDVEDIGTEDEEGGGTEDKEDGKDGADDRGH